MSDSDEKAEEHVREALIDLSLRTSELLHFLDEADLVTPAQVPVLLRAAELALDLAVDQWSDWVEEHAS